MSLDDADNIQRFISQMSQINGQPAHSSLSTVTSTPTTEHDQLANHHGPNVDDIADSKHDSEDNESDGVTTPPHTTLAGQDHEHLTSPEAHPRPSPHISGLTAPHNTPKTAASSPRLAAAHTHNEDVAEAFSDYVNAMDGRPLSESMWAPGSARYKPSVLSGARSTRVLTPTKAVEPNPAINDTFDRMSFRAADPEVGQNLIGNCVTQSLFSKAPPSSVNKLSVLTEKSYGDKVDDIQGKPEAASNENFQRPFLTNTTKRIEYKIDGANLKDSGTPAHTNTVEKENQVPSTSKVNVLPHLRVTRSSSQKPGLSTRVPAQDLNKFSAFESSQTLPSSDQNLASSELAVKAETHPPCHVSDPVHIQDTIRATTDYLEPKVESKVTTDPAGAKRVRGTSECEDLENQTFFNGWPKSEERSKPAAEVRTVIIKDLPRGSTATFVASLVYGGRIEDIHVRSSAAGEVSAVVRFMDAGECMRFYVETSNGLVYDKDAKGRELVLFVELSRDVDVVGGLLRGWIVSGVTRCVRVVGVAAAWNMDGLLKIAERKHRKVEKIVDGRNPGGARSVVFRFCKVDDAVQFKAALSRDEEWEHCNILYATDPCAATTGVHLED